ncbi:uronate isomerase [Arthrobacter sp. Hiyo8]|nr:uronate isomerase [Arthrobacter sp. Hiyo8]
MSQSIAANPDRLLPADPGTRSIARSLLERVQDLPIISPHGHVDAAVIEHNTPFPIRPRSWSARTTTSPG